MSVDFLSTADARAIETVWHHFLPELVPKDIKGPVGFKIRRDLLKQVLDTHENTKLHQMSSDEFKHVFDSCCKVNSISTPVDNHWTRSVKEWIRKEVEQNKLTWLTRSDNARAKMSESQTRRYGNIPQVRNVNSLSEVETALFQKHFNIDMTKVEITPRLQKFIAGSLYILFEIPENLMTDKALDQFQDIIAVARDTIEFNHRAQETAEKLAAQEERRRALQEEQQKLDMENLQLSSEKKALDEKKLKTIQSLVS